MDKEEENEFLATVDPENVKVTDKVETVTVEKANKSTKSRNKQSKQTEICEQDSRATPHARQVISERLVQISCQVL